MKVYLMAAIVLLVLMSYAFASSQTQRGKRPNVLFIAADDLRMNLGCYGDTLAVTPNIDKLASEGLLFTRSFCQFPSCNASRASVLTGQRPDSISVWHLNTNFRKTVPDAVTLPQHFKENGYHTEAIGKVLHNYYNEMRDNDLSWSTPARMDKINHFKDYALEENLPSKKEKLEKTSVSECADITADTYADGRITADAVQTIKKLSAQEAPFFLAVGFMKPHSPYNAPKRYWDLYNRAELKILCSDAPPTNTPALNWFQPREIRGFSDVPNRGPIPVETQARMRHGYYAATSYLDANVGKVLEALETSGVADNTIIVFWSDHGYHLGENGHWTKVTVRDLDAQVPLLIKSPDNIGGKTSAMVEYIDIYPTLSDLCDLPRPAGLDGKSFVHLFDDPEVGFRTAALTQVCRPWPGNHPIESMGYSIRTLEHRYTRWVNFKNQKVIAEEIYDLSTDPYQRNNLIGDETLLELISHHRAMMDVEIKVSQ